MTPTYRPVPIAFVGCGYVFDHYMTTHGAHPELVVRGVFDLDRARAETVGRVYGFRVYASYAELLADDVELVVNLTSIEAHFDVTRTALEAGKHVYSEKPLTTDLAEARALFDLAAAKGLTLSAAPCNFLSDTVQTMWRAVRDRAIGTPLLVYAEFDDNPIYLMKPEGWRSRTGAPWPYVHEYEAGCTFEHVGYHLVWLCAMFGPVRSVTAFAKALVAHKTDVPLHPADTPDFSVAVLDFASGVTARVTCSIVAPADHRLRIIGTEGELSTDTYRHYQSPVTLERFSSLSLNARKARSVRTVPALGRLFGVGGRTLPLVAQAKSHATTSDTLTVRPSWPRRVVNALKRREVGAQDKLLGVAATARALATGTPCPIPADFILHVTELTLAIQNAGPNGGATALATTFAPLSPIPEAAALPDARAAWRPAFLERRLEPILDRLHQN